MPFASGFSVFGLQLTGNTTPHYGCGNVPPHRARITPHTFTETQAEVNRIPWACGGGDGDSGGEAPDRVILDVCVLVCECVLVFVCRHAFIKCVFMVCMHLRGGSSEGFVHVN